MKSIVSFTLTFKIQVGYAGFISLRNFDTICLHPSIGFVHSAFVLRAEGHLDKSSHFGKHIPRGELVELLSKALLYSEVEVHWRGNAITKNCTAPFTLLDKHVCALDPTVTPITVLQPLPSIDVPQPAPNGTSEKRKASSPAVDDGGGPKEKRARTEEMEVDSVTSSAERTSMIG